MFKSLKGENGMDINVEVLYSLYFKYCYLYQRPVNIYLSKWDDIFLFGTVVESLGEGCVVSVVAWFFFWLVRS